MSDIVERLRKLTKYEEPYTDRLIEGAAAEIERLEANFAEANLAREHFIRAIRAATIEECAGVAERYLEGLPNELEPTKYEKIMFAKIAAAIRALKEQS